MMVGDPQNSDSVIEDQVSDVEAETRDGRSPDLEIRGSALDDRSGSGPLSEQAEDLLDRVQELAAEP